MEILQAADLNNQALNLESIGDYNGAEKKHLQALKIKRESPNGSKIGIGLTLNALGDLYLTMGRLDDAQKMLEEALECRRGAIEFEEVITCDNLGRLYEMRGNRTECLKYRTIKAPDCMVCSNYDCMKSKINCFSKMSQLKKCGNCKCVFYCDTGCQKQDWKRHKKYCKQLADSS